MRWLTRTFVWIIRGTPLMLQLFVVFYVPGIVFKVITGIALVVLGGVFLKIHFEDRKKEKEKEKAREEARARARAKIEAEAAEEEGK